MFSLIFYIKSILVQTFDRLVEKILSGLFKTHKKKKSEWAPDSTNNSKILFYIIKAGPLTNQSAS